MRGSSCVCEAGSKDLELHWCCEMIFSGRGSPLRFDSFTYLAFSTDRDTAPASIFKRNRYVYLYGWVGLVSGYDDHEGGLAGWLVCVYYWGARAGLSFHGLIMWIPGSCRPLYQTTPEP